MAALHEHGLVVERHDLAATAARSPSGAAACALTPSMMARVEAEPLFRMRHQHRRAGRPRAPSLRCGGKPSRTWADVAHVDRGAVHRLDRQVVQLVDGVGAVVELHIVFERPILAVPAGMIWFWAASAVLPRPRPTDPWPAAPGDRGRSGSAVPCRHKAREPPSRAPSQRRADEVLRRCRTTAARSASGWTAPAAGSARWRRCSSGSAAA